MSLDKVESVDSQPEHSRPHLTTGDVTVYGRREGKETSRTIASPLRSAMQSRTMGRYLTMAMHSTRRRIAQQRSIRRIRQILELRTSGGTPGVRWPRCTKINPSVTYIRDAPAASSSGNVKSLNAFPDCASLDTGCGADACCAAFSPLVRLLLGAQVIGIYPPPPISRSRAASCRRQGPIFLIDYRCTQPPNRWGTFASASHLCGDGSGLARHRCRLVFLPIAAPLCSIPAADGALDP